MWFDAGTHGRSTQALQRGALVGGICSSFAAHLESNTCGLCVVVVVDLLWPWSRAELVDGGVSTHPSRHRAHPSWLRVARKSGASRAGQQSVQARAFACQERRQFVAGLQGC